ncbi:hypothetical protein MTO96_001321 [Rhipicephalus appendiculatus]
MDEAAVQNACQAQATATGCRTLRGRRFDHRTMASNAWEQGDERCGENTRRQRFGRRRVFLYLAPRPPLRPTE